MIGFRMGEAAGAKALVREAIYAVARQSTRRGAETSLAAAFVAPLGARDVDDLIEGLTAERYMLTGAAAPLVFAEAERGDQVARDLIGWAGHELGSLAIGVVRQLDLQSAPFDLVLIGSLFRGGPLLVGAVDETVRPVAPHARLVRLKAPAVVGGVLLAMGPRRPSSAGAIHEALVRGSRAFVGAGAPAP